MSLRYNSNFSKLMKSKKKPPKKPSNINFNNISYLTQYNLMYLDRHQYIIDKKITEIVLHFGGTKSWKSGGYFTLTACLHSDSPHFRGSAATVASG